MSSNDNNCCPVWPSVSPYNGGPFPTRLWSRASLPCTALSDAERQALDMRRKAETLQHRQNQNQLSKSQIWSRVNRGFGPSRRRSWATQNWTYTNPNTYGLPLNNDTLTCSGESVISAPASASDVPGGGVLTYDPSVPLSGWRVQRQYRAGGTKWPQSTTNIPVPRQYFVENIPNPILCSGGGGIGPDPASWIRVTYISPKLSPATSYTISRYPTLTSGEGDYQYLVLLFGCTTVGETDPTAPPLDGTQLQARVEVLETITGQIAVNEVGILALAGAGAGASGDTDKPTGGGGGGACYSVQRTITTAVTYDIDVGQGGKARENAGSGGNGAASRVQEDSVTILEVSGGGGSPYTGTAPGVGAGGTVVTPAAGGTGGSSSTSFSAAAGASTTWNSNVPVPKDVWNLAVWPLMFYIPSVNEDVATASLGGGGSAGDPSTADPANANWGGPTVNNKPVAFAASLDRYGANGSTATNSGTWGAGGGGAPPSVDSGLPPDPTKTRRGGVGGNGFVLMWFKHPTNK